MRSVGRCDTEHVIGVHVGAAHEGGWVGGRSGPIFQALAPRVAPVIGAPNEPARGGVG